MGTRAGAGTLTLLFTDLVGSTESLVALGEDRFDSVRDDHDALVGGAIAARDGEVVKHTGDGYMAAFPCAGDAVAAAVAIQRLIARRNEGAEVALGIRIGISAGDVVERAGDYRGVAAVEAARMCAAARGGQILASETVRTLVGLRGGHDFVPLGELDLKGLPPVATVAVRWCDDAPVVAPARGSRGNLPASADRFVGRLRDRDAIRELLRERRLVTLTGPGGAGKTRLALEVARAVGAERADGVWLVELASIDDAELVAEATMTALGLRGGDAEAGDAVRSHLAGRDALLVVDNCEHVVGGAARLIAELLAACPGVRVVATSREPLRVAGEAEYLVEGLVREEAIELLAERVPGQRRVDDPAAVERICGALDGIPLAIELAAARLRVLSLGQLADRLDDQLAVLAHGRRTAPERQRTLRATLDGSYDLLDVEERVMFRRLGIFAGGFTAVAAEHVVADNEIPRAQVIDLLERLVECSLLTSVPGGSGVRFRLLEPVRQYAAERLGEAGERNAVARRHLEWIEDFARHALTEFFVAQRDTTASLRQEHSNISQALEFALDTGDAITAGTIVAALGFPWREIGPPDARLWCERVLAALPADAPALIRAGVLASTAMMLQQAAQYDPARSLLLEARQLYRDADNVRGEAWALTGLGWDAFYRAPASAETKALCEEALSRYRESNTPAGAGAMLVILGEVALHAEDDALARQRAQEAVQLGRFTRIGQTVAAGLRMLAILDARAGDFRGADRRLAESIAIYEAAGDRYQLIQVYADAAEMAASRGNISLAVAHLVASANLGREMSSKHAMAFPIRAGAHLAYVEGRPREAAVLFGVLLGLNPSTLAKHYRPILEALETQGLHNEIAAGANLTTDEALAHVAALTLNTAVNPPAQDNRWRGAEPQPVQGLSAG